MKSSPRFRPGASHLCHRFENLFGQFFCIFFSRMKRAHFWLNPSTWSNWATFIIPQRGRRFFKRSAHQRCTPSIIFVSPACELCTCRTNSQAIRPEDHAQEGCTMPPPWCIPPMYLPPRGIFFHGAEEKFGLFSQFLDPPVIPPPVVPPVFRPKGEMHGIQFRFQNKFRTSVFFRQPLVISWKNLLTQEC